MNETLKATFEEIYKEDVELKIAIAAHNAKVAEIMKDETEALNKRAAIHEAKAAAFFKEAGVKDGSSIIGIVKELLG